MIKSSFKVFFKNLPFLFIPMGLIYLFIIIFVYNFATNSFGEIVALVQNIANVTGTAIDVNQEEIYAYLQGLVEQIDFSGSIFDVLTQIFSGNFLIDSINELLNIIFVGYEDVSKEYSQLISNSAFNIQANLIGNIVVILFSLPLSYVLTSFVMKKNTFKRTIKQSIIAFVINPLGILVVGFITLLLFSLWTPSIYITIVLIVIIFGYISLFEAFIIHNDGNIKFKDVVTLKKSLLLILSSILILITGGLLLFLISLISTPIIVFLLAIPAIIYLYICITLNAESYILHEIENLKNRKIASRKN